MEEELTIEEESPRATAAVREALKRLTQFINASDAEIARLTQAEAHLSQKEEMLSGLLRTTEQQAFDQREEVRRLSGREKDLLAQIADLTQRVEKSDDALKRRAEEAEERAARFETLSEDLSKKAVLGEKLSDAAVRMIEALERLPSKPEDVTPMQANPSGIPLLDTYEWQAVSDAKFLMSRLMETWPEPKDNASSST